MFLDKENFFDSRSPQAIERQCRYVGFEHPLQELRAIWPGKFRMAGKQAPIRLTTGGSGNPPLHGIADSVQLLQRNRQRRHDHDDIAERTQPNAFC